MLQVMSEYPKGRTALGDLIASELAKDPDNPLNRAKRAAEEARLRGESAATSTPPPPPPPALASGSGRVC